jgi:two-component system response regulator (stage 0 sporulation protein F)
MAIAKEANVKAKIMIVDDEENLIYFLRQALEFQFPGCSVDAAYSGEEGLSHLAEHAYDLIIADYRMPGFSGLELIQGVRYLDSQTRIILMTAYGSDDLRGEAGTLGVSHYFQKPFDVDEMLAAVGRLIGAGEGIAGA